MNVLAHAWLASRAGESIVGHLLGDFVKGRAEDRWEGDLLHGIHRHRKIDAYTDDHPAVRRSVRRFRGEFRRWGGVLADMYYDHVLANAWGELGEGTLRSFADRVYGELEEHRPRLPQRMQHFTDFMRASDLLVSYTELEGIDRSLQGISRRVRRANPLADGVTELEREGERLGADFREFVPDLLAEFTPGRGPEA